MCSRGCQQNSLPSCQDRCSTHYDDALGPPHRCSAQRCFRSILLPPHAPIGSARVLRLIPVLEQGVSLPVDSYISCFSIGHLSGPLGSRCIQYCIQYYANSRYFLSPGSLHHGSSDRAGSSYLSKTRDTTNKVIATSGSTTGHLFGIWIGTIGIVCRRSVLMTLLQGGREEGHG